VLAQLDRRRLRRVEQEPWDRPVRVHDAEQLVHLADARARNDLDHELEVRRAEL
jgi:hypothetical protein